MKFFFERYKDSGKKLLQAVAVLQWGHNLLLINKKLSDIDTDDFTKCIGANR